VKASSVPVHAIYAVRAVLRVEAPVGAVMMAVRRAAAERFLAPAVAVTMAVRRAAAECFLAPAVAVTMDVRRAAAGRYLALVQVKTGEYAVREKYDLCYAAVLNLWMEMDRDADGRAHLFGVCAVVLSVWRVAAPDHCAYALMRRATADHLTFPFHVTDYHALLSGFASPAD
jgi:hypothetical protein